jgi:O-antigen/teichoic acid export membrane protein
MSLNRPILLVLSSDLVSKILLGLVWLLLIRHLPPQEFALLTLATSVAVVASQTLGASINRIYILSSPEVNTGDPTPLILFQLCVLFLLGIGGLPFAEVLPGTAYVLTLLLASGILLSDFGKTVYQKQLKFSIFSMIELARSTLVATALVVLVMQLESGVRAWQVLALQALGLGTILKRPGRDQRPRIEPVGPHGGSLDQQPGQRFQPRQQKHARAPGRRRIPSRPAPGV